MPVSVRMLAADTGRPRTGVQRGLDWLRERNVVVRRPDPSRRNGFTYQVVDPGEWRYAGRAAPPRRAPGDPSPDHVEGWSEPLLRFAPQSRPLHKVFHSQRWGVPAGEDTRARSSSAEEKELGKENIENNNHEIDHWYLWWGGKKLPVVTATSMFLDEIQPGLEELLPARTAELPARVVAEVKERFDRASEQRWPVWHVRRFIARAVEVSEARRADDLEKERRDAEAQELRRRRWAEDLVLRWRRLEDDASWPDVEHDWAAIGMQGVLEGRLGELKLVDALVEEVEERQLLLHLTQSAESADKATLVLDEPEAIVQADPVLDLVEAGELIEKLRVIGVLEDEVAPEKPRRGRHPEQLKVWLPWLERVRLGREARDTADRLSAEPSWDLVRLGGDVIERFERLDLPEGASEPKGNSGNVSGEEPPRDEPAGESGEASIAIIGPREKGTSERLRRASGGHEWREPDPPGEFGSAFRGATAIFARSPLFARLPSSIRAWFGDVNLLPSRAMPSSK